MFHVTKLFDRSGQHLMLQVNQRSLGGEFRVGM